MKGDAAQQLQKLGGAKVILATAPNAKAISGLAPGLKYKGKLLIVAAPQDNIEVSPLLLLMGSRVVAGHYSGYAKDSEDTLNFSVLTGVKPMVEVYPLAKVNEAYERMLSAAEPISARAYFEHLIWLMAQRTPERQLALEVGRRGAA